MSDLTSGLLALLGGSGLVGFAALVVRAFLQALRATADVSEEKNRTIDRQAATITRQDKEIDDLNLKLLAGLRELVAKDAEIAHLRAKTGGTT
jgi:hypothetical protein